MKRLLAVITLSLAAIWSVNVLAAEIAVVNMQQIFRSSPQIKAINAQLSKQFATRRNSIMQMGKALQTNLKKYQKNQSVMNAKQLSVLRQKIRNQEVQLRRAQAQFQKDLFTAQNKRMSGFITKVKMAVKNVAMQKGLTLVVPSNTVLYSKGNMDITSQVITKLK